MPIRIENVTGSHFHTFFDGPSDVDLTVKGLNLQHGHTIFNIRDSQIGIDKILVTNTLDLMRAEQARGENITEQAATKAAEKSGLWDVCKSNGLTITSVAIQLVSLFKQIYPQ